MTSRYPVKKAASLVLCILTFSLISSGQLYRFSNFQSQDGLPGSNVVYTIDQDKGGFLWLGTTDGLARFDGIEFIPVSYPDTTVTGNVSASLKDKSGTIWFGFSNGAVCAEEGGKLIKIIPDDSSSVAEIIQAPDGFIYVLHQQRGTCFKIDMGRRSVAAMLPKPPDDVFSAAFLQDDEILLGSQGKIIRAIIEDGELKITGLYDDFDYARVLAIQKLPGSSRCIVGTEGNGIFLVDISGRSLEVSRIAGYPELESISVKDIFSDESGTVWISTLNNGVVKIGFSENGTSVVELKYFITSSGLAGDRINVVSQDSEGNIWIGHNGKGLSKLSSEAFSFIMPGDEKKNNIINISRHKDSYFLGTPEGYYIYNAESGKTESFTSLSRATGGSMINAYHVDKNLNIWIGTKGGGLYLQKNNGKTVLFYKSGESGQDNINDIEADNNNVWIASVNGVTIIDAASGRMKEYYNMNNRLPFNNASKLSLSSSGSAWVATQSTTFDRIEPGKGVVYSKPTMGQARRNKILTISEGSNGDVLAGTEGYGLYIMKGDSVINVTTSNGLFSDKVNSIFADSKGIVWAGHDRGVSMYSEPNGIARGFSTDFARQGQCNPDAIFETSDGKILIGTTEGLLIYDRTKDNIKDLAPVSNIVSIIIEDIAYPYTPSFRLPYRDHYKVTVKYSGIKLSDPQRVYYSTFLENYDDKWSSFTSERSKTFSLNDGRYKFSLVSVSQDGLQQENPLSFDIVVLPPLWRRWWFLLSLLVLMIALVIHLIKVREKAARLREKELERKVEERTNEVETQKKEIERQNLEITDSINYAKRIQSSVLPDVSRLKESFSDAFILFHPRDIVSGDFYWYDKTEDGTVVVVCADSTGHGVPGAFMSMIGSSFLQDIVKRQNITTPSKILSHLDKQIFAMLNQNAGNEVANDGIDLVVCEYNPLKRYLRFAAAMRPVIMMMDGELYYIKGNKHSVGGESTSGKYFDDQEYFLKQGDMIYLFTDGLADQFGGPSGKKMLIPKLRSFIESHHQLPLAEQKVELSKFFYEWKKGEEQVDDVLFMGLRI